MWSIVVFWLLLIPLLITLIVTYAKSKRFYRMFYILSVFTYTMAITYVIDAYELGRDPILGLLGFSAVLMMYIGYRFHKATKRKKHKTSIKSG